jgi:hypothetical protein
LDPDRSDRAAGKHGSKRIWWRDSSCASLVITQHLCLINLLQSEYVLSAGKRAYSQLAARQFGQSRNCTKKTVSLPRLASLSNVVLYFREFLVEAPEIVLSGREKNTKSIITLVQAGFELPAAKVSYLQVQDPGCLSHDPREAHLYADASRHRLPAAAGANPSISIKVWDQ